MDYLLQELFCPSCHPQGFRLKLKRPGDGETKPIDKRQDFVETSRAWQVASI